MIYEMENWGFSVDKNTGEVIQPALPNAQPGDSFVQCNFSRFTLGDIFPGVTGLKFLDCNLVNCNLPQDAEVDGNTAINDYEVVNV